MAGDSAVWSMCRLAGTCEVGLGFGVELIQCMPLFEVFVIVFGVIVGLGGRPREKHFCNLNSPSASYRGASTPGNGRP
ncbi:hypothetical protein WDL1P2_00571 (plasmid) [Variovorax sp. WDL1]|nr:hypothetical protein CHC06_06678 [Variovorax sp. B2]PNG49417.1 hypothetical protein CHC07_06326 [Variovorax sp. B4]VTV18964.1 hypothetical protein WDL1P2_00571 [Variovorax sp. WDL1]